MIVPCRLASCMRCITLLNLYIHDTFARSEKRRNMLLQRYKRSPRHTIQVDYVTYMDELAGKVGCRVPMGM